MSIDLRAAFLTSATMAFWVAVSTPSYAAGCEDLLNLNLPDTKIKTAQPVAAGDFVGPNKVARSDLPAFCRVTASVTASPDSDIEVEVWLPVDKWTGVFHGNGSGGYGGTLAAGYTGMAAGLQRGYATAVTDMGTAPASSLNGDPLVGHPQKWKDWGLLSTHVMTATGKAIAKAFYGESPKRSYFTGCSTGGQQALIEAQYFPEDYDGILAGAPVINRTWGHAAVLWDYMSANTEPDRKLSDQKLALLNSTAISTCGGRGNGLSKDPFVSDPLSCKFNPAVLACKGADVETCLTAPEVQTAKDFYSGPINGSGHPTYYGWLPGSEMPSRSGWSFLESTPSGEPGFDGLFKWVFGADWDWHSFDFNRDMPKVDALLGPDLNGVVRGDLSRFRARGGKLIIFQGWADTLVAPGQTIEFYDGLGGQFGGAAKVQEFAKLFMAPGMMHCGGGPGPGAFNSANGGMSQPHTSTAKDDLFSAISDWVERGTPPKQVIATKYDSAHGKGIVMRRPICAYPARAWYGGSGDTDNADNFACAVEKPLSR